MNDQQPQDWERAMSHEFDRRVRDLNEAPLTMDHVKGAALTIRRKRRAVLAGGVLAAAAVIAPVAILSLGGGDQSTLEPVAPSPTVATESADPTPVPTPDPTEAVPSDANPLGVTYLDGRRLIRGDGSVVELSRDYNGGTPLSEDLFLGGYFETPNSDDPSIGVDLLDSNGAVIDSESAVTLPVSNDDHTVGAYLTTDGGLRLRSASADATVPVTFRNGDTPVAVVGEADCIELESCVVFVRSADFASTSAVGQDGRADVLTNGIEILDDARADGLAVGSTSTTDQGSCNAVVAGPTQEQRFESCEFGYLSFSPDLDRLSGEPPYVDGFGPAWAGIYSAQDGTEVARFQPADGGITESVWQDNDNLLVNTFDFADQSWRIVRLNVDGTQTTVLGPSPASDFDSPYTLIGGQ